VATEGAGPPAENPGPCGVAYEAPPVGVAWVFLVAAVAAVGWLAWERPIPYGTGGTSVPATTSNHYTERPETNHTAIPDARSAWARAMGKTACLVARLVAVGTATRRDADGLVWASADGSAWTLLDLEGDGVGGPGDQVVSSVAAGVDSSRRERRRAVWVSADGHTWGGCLHDQASSAGRGAGRLASWSWEGGLIAVGSVGMGATTMRRVAEPLPRLSGLRGRAQRGRQATTRGPRRQLSASSPSRTSTGP